MNVREKHPQRRQKPTKSPRKGRWTEHKPDLREDFNCQCGYCGSYDGFRHTWFEVDHFIPKSLLEENNKSTEEYSNLVYSCKFCNNNKSAKWPSNDINVPNLNDEGFVDPCDIDYDRHLYRTESGGIMWKTKLGKWMWKYAFKFDERDYCIKLLWEVNQLRKAVLCYAEVLSRLEENTNEYKDLKKRAGDLSFEYVLIHNDLMNYYNNL